MRVGEGAGRGWGSTAMSAAISAFVARTLRTCRLCDAGYSMRYDTGGSCGWMPRVGNGGGDDGGGVGTVAWMPWCGECDSVVFGSSVESWGWASNSGSLRKTTAVKSLTLCRKWKSRTPPRDRRGLGVGTRAGYAHPQKNRAHPTMLFAYIPGLYSQSGNPGRVEFVYPTTTRVR